MENELAHWGIKGMRWGIRRYQNKDGSLTPEGEKRYDKSSEEYEARKQKAIKSGSATEVLKFKGDLTSEEMRSISERLKFEQDIKSISDREIASGKSAADKFFKKVDKSLDYTTTCLKAWNTFANIYNAFHTDSISLPKVDTNVLNGNRGVIKEEKKKKKEEAEAEAKKQKEAEAAAKKQKEAEAAAKKQKEEAEAAAKKQKEAEAAAKKQREEDVTGIVTISRQEEEELRKRAKRSR